MRIMRMFVIILALSIGGGVFGAGIGALIGYGMPRSISGQYQIDATEGPQGEARLETSSKGVRVGVGEDDDGKYATKGASLGAALGLILGFVLSLPFALADQFMVQIVDWMGNRKQKADGSPSS